MPGIIMENGNRNGSHTNHDRDQRPNGINGASHASEKPPDKGKGRAEPQQNVTPTSPVAPNGLNGGFVSDAGQGELDATPRDMQDPLLQLPPELNHITYGYISLKDMLARLAQKTHSDLLDTITELAQMSLPASALNGNPYNHAAVDDNSPENINKKVRLLQYLQSAHASWTKALVIAGWSRRAAEVSRVIDLHVHLSHEKNLYLDLIDRMGNDKKELNGARLLNPDLRTALEVLTTGKVSWMPDVCLYSSSLWCMLTLPAWLHSATSTDRERNSEVLGKKQYSSFHAPELDRL
jgi:mediator of RNA polymerase II transcription subunit 14